MARYFSRFWLAGGLWLFSAAPAIAALDTQASLHFSEQYSNNSGYSASNPQEEWTSTISPRISLSTTLLDAKLSLSYSPQYYHFARQTHKNQFRHQIDLNLADSGAMTLVPGYVYLQVQESMNQHVVDNSVAPTFENQTTVNNFSISPFVARRLGDWAGVKLGYRYQRTDAFNDQVDDAQQHSISGDVLMGSGRIMGGLNVSRAWSFHRLSRDYVADSWVLRVALRPSATTGVSGYVGRNAFEMDPAVKLAGRTYGAQWNQRVRNSTFVLAHDVNVSSTSDLLQGRDWTVGSPFGESDGFHYEPHVFILDGVPYWYNGKNDTFIRARDGNFYRYDGRFVYLLGGIVDIQAAGLVETQRSSLRFSMQISKVFASVMLYRQANEYLTVNHVIQTNQDSISYRNTQTKGLFANLQWTATPRTTVNASANLTGNRFYYTGQADRIWQFGLNLARRMRPTLSGNLDYTYQKKRSNMPGLEYDAHRLMASISKTW